MPVEDYEFIDLNVGKADPSEPDVDFNFNMKWDTSLHNDASIRRHGANIAALLKQRKPSTAKDAVAVVREYIFGIPGIEVEEGLVGLPEDVLKELTDKIAAEDGK